MGRTWTQYEWSEMDGQDVVNFAASHFEDSTFDLVVWLYKISTPVLVEALEWANDQFWTNGCIRAEAGRRLLKAWETSNKTQSQLGIENSARSLLKIFIEEVVQEVWRPGRAASWLIEMGYAARTDNKLDVTQKGRDYYRALNEQEGGA